MRMNLCILTVGILVVVAVFGQVDSTDQAVTAVIRQSLKPIDTTINIAPVHMVFNIARNKNIKGRFAGTGLDTVRLRVIDAKPKPLASGDTLKVDSLQVVVTMTVTKVWGLRTVSGGLIIPREDSTIILTAPRP